MWQLSASIGETPWAKRRRANRGGGGGGGEGGETPHQTLHETPPRPFLGSTTTSSGFTLNAGMASLGRAASMSSKKFADAMGSAAAATPKPQPQHVETRRLGSAIYRRLLTRASSSAQHTSSPHHSPIRSRSTTARERWHKCRIHAIALSRASKSRISTIALSRASDCRPVVRALGDGKLVRSEFVDLCIDVMWGLPVVSTRCDSNPSLRPHPSRNPRPNPGPHPGASLGQADPNPKPWPSP